MPALDQVIANGWVLVATDYVGLGTDSALIPDPRDPGPHRRQASTVHLLGLNVLPCRDNARCPGPARPP